MTRYPEWIYDRLNEHKGLVAQRILAKAVLIVNAAEGTVYQQTFCSANGVIFSAVIRQIDVNDGV